MDLQTPNSTHLDVRDLSVVRSERTIFSDVSFTLNAGACLILTGPNGSGKTTLLKTIAGFIDPQSGRIAASKGPESFAYFGHQIGLKANETVLSALTFWAEFLEVDGGKVHAVMDELSLCHLAQKPCGKLSAGQQHRVALARLAMSNKPIWLLDEPTAPLDEKTKLKLKDIIDKHRSCSGSVIAATHSELGWVDTEMLDLGT